MSSISVPEDQDVAGKSETAPPVDAGETTVEPAAVHTAAPEPVVPVAKIKSIEVRFSKAIKDINHRIIPFGTATATYSSGPSVVVEVTGGCNVNPYGITDPVKNLPVVRVESSHYLNHKGQPMPYALFYHGGEALHVGRIDKTSHGCVHVGDAVKMKKLNQDTVRNKTTVSVIYEAGVLDKVMKQHL